MPAPFSGTGGCPCPLVSAHHGELEAWGDFGEGRKKKRKIKFFPSSAVLGPVFEAATAPIPSGCSPPPPPLSAG